MGCSGISFAAPLLMFSLSDINAIAVDALSQYHALVEPTAYIFQRLGPPWPFAAFLFVSHTMRKAGH
ncbi:hypothetical protein WOLCODRAFT_134702 [Wolfiporia cocos MD-104 SS10]|uniref:Uncharacterized protein n=1 Tax=Wolfiporia cocos (strain MD-104) TaxID=742152 RepID=A0A2H3JAX4_WOLCO|nr:hypothetical protein WOLCODRAFT_134702 [Wolfiporia cocos MD-104 SS10]